MDALTFADARRTVLDRVRVHRRPLSIEIIDLATSLGRVLAADIRADRDYPTLPRSVRDGFAVRAADVPATLSVIGEVRAGELFPNAVQGGEAVEIMTGAPVPAGADAVVMIEHVQVEGGTVKVSQAVEPGLNINLPRSEATAGETLLPAGTRVGYPEVALMASVGAAQVPVFRRPRVAILPTGDELVPVDGTPLPHQIRNSNGASLAAQVVRAGGDAIVLPVALDEQEATRDLIEQGLQTDLLLLSGGVSAGKYDVVEIALRSFGVEFYFDRVLIQPGQPCVFGRAGETFVFGLPGNPASTMVCFEIFARGALELIAGIEQPELLFTQARLATPFRHKPGLTRFLPASLNPDGTLTPIRWAGSSDIASLTRANCYLVAAPDKPDYAQGDWIEVLMQ